MNAADYHKQLADWGASSHWLDLIDKTLISPETPNVDEYNVGGRLSKKINAFIFQNPDLLSETDRIPLKTLRVHIVTFKRFSGFMKFLDPKGYLSKLEKKINECIERISSQPLPDDYEIKIHLTPPPGAEKISSLFTCPSDYYMTNGLQDSFSGTGTLKMITASFVKASRKEIEEFAQIAFIQMSKNPATFQKMIDTFFRHAPVEQFSRFFSHVKDAEFLNEIIKALPTSITHLNLEGCALLEDSHIKTITGRMTRLEALNLKGCNLLTENAISLICNAKNMKKLMWLRVESKLITDATATHIILSPYLNKLIDLDCLYTFVSPDLRLELDKFLCKKISKKTEEKS